MSFHEMALLNIAFAHGQLGNAKQAKLYYRRALEEYPDSGMAEAALKLIETAERSAADSSDEVRS